MNAIIILDTYQEIDVLESIKATVEALPTGTVFTAEEMEAAFIAARPEEEEAGIRRLTGKSLSNTFSNPLVPSIRYYLCDEIGNGQYRRHGEMAQPVEMPVVEPPVERKEQSMIEKPTLIGSEKQIAWAEMLRDSYIAIMSQTHLASVIRTVAEHPEARYWIDGRYGLGVTNAQQRDIQKLWKK